ncbi:hypothetical protein GGR58DRAFT_467764 [Xylaria digitata]|nr:hypothetical protein GGR58DRAFT_467764 [Xylaria digitata]
MVIGLYEYPHLFRVSLFAFWVRLSLAQYVLFLCCLSQRPRNVTDSRARGIFSRVGTAVERIELILYFLLQRLKLSSLYHEGYNPL